MDYIELNQRQIDKIEELGLEEIAKKADRGEELTEDEKNKWAAGDKDLDGVIGFFGEPSRENLERGRQEAQEVVDCYTEKIEARQQSDYELSDREGSDYEFSDYESDSSDEACLLFITSE
jgi:hypothetical protein